MTNGNQPVVNKRKLILLPMTLVIITLLLSSLSGYFISRRYMLDQMKEDGYAYASLLNQKMEAHRIHRYHMLALASGGEVDSEDLMEYLQDHELQQVLENVAADESIHYALFLDTTLTAIADSDPQDVGIQYADDPAYLATLAGEKTADVWFYETIGDNVMEVAIPYRYNGEVIGILAVGLSMDNLRYNLYWTRVAFALISVVMLMLFTFIQRNLIIIPLERLDEEIRELEIDVTNATRLPERKKDPFLGLYTGINHLLKRIYDMVHQNEALHKTIQVQAMHDPLTNLPNRRAFRGDIEASFRLKEQGAVMMLDLDNFKDINDTFGHVYGDHVLKTVTDFLESITTDHISIYRFGGDEFLMLYRQPDSMDHVEAFVKTILDRFNQRFTIDDDDQHLKCSIGIARYPHDSGDIDELVMQADLAMYQSKENRLNCYARFKPHMAEKKRWQLEVEQRLRTALEEDGFRLLYQPKVDAQTRQVTGYEALLRLKDNTLSPGQFIPVAEETGLILDIGRWVTREAISQLKAWKQEGKNTKLISINFSAKQLFDLDYVKNLEKMLKEAGVNPSLLEIEITENLLIDQEETTIQFLNQLKKTGVKLSLDDFGKGYSSLNYLSYLTVDAIKLDKSLCDKYQEFTNSKIVVGIISLAESLNLRIVAEGIETKDQYHFFKESGCHDIQGFLFSKPVPAAEATAVYDQVLEMKRL